MVYSSFSRLEVYIAFNVMVPAVGKRRSVNVNVKKSHFKMYIYLKCHISFKIQKVAKVFALSTAF